MAAVKGKLTEEQNIARLKDEFVDYYVKVPVIKYAGMFVGRSDDTIQRWLESDSVFAARVEKARAQWVASRLPKARVEFALERLEKQIFAERKELTGAEGKDLLPTPIISLDVSRDDSNQQAPTAQETN